MAAGPKVEGVRIPPHHVQAEKSVLGAMMLSEDAVSRACETLQPEDFYYEINGRIFRTMAQLYSSGQPVDFVTLTDRLEREGALDLVGGYDFIAEINGFVPSAANAEDYIVIVKDRSVLRRLIKSCASIMEDCYTSEKDVGTILSDAEKAIFTISQEKNRKGFVSIQHALDEMLARVEHLATQGEVVVGMKTAYTNLDAQLSGLQPSQLILIAARPAMGKTAFALNITERVARFNENATVAYFSLEMPYEQLVSRMASSVGMVPLQNLRTGQVKNNEWPKLQSAAEKLAETRIFIDDTSGVTVMEIWSKCRRLKLERGLSLVVIDYLQLLNSAGTSRKNDNRQQEISEITRFLKIMARELDVPVVLLSQLSRATERRDNHRPNLADLRESGAIEQDADVVMFLYREAYYASEKPDADTMTISNEAEIIISKQRNGPTGTVKLLWDGPTASFVLPPDAGQWTAKP